MRTFIFYLVILVSLSARLAISTQTTELQWQLPVEEENVNGQHSDQKKPQLHIRLQGCYGKDCPSEQKRSDSVDDSAWLSSPLNLLLMTEPDQAVHICAGQLQAEDGKLPDSLTSITASLNDGYIYQVRPCSMMTPLTLTNPIRCPEQFGHFYDYNAGKVFFSDKPFLVRFYPKQTTKKINHNDASGALPSDMTPTTPATILFGGGGFDPGMDDLFPKRPGRGFITNAPDISLTLLPLVRLDWDWQRILPLTNWRQWLFGSRDESSGITLQVRVDGRLAGTYQLNPQEFQQLLPSLTDIKTAFRWLAPKLNGREALINYLLQWSSAESPLSDEFREAVEQQLAAVLEYDDNEFCQLHLDFEIHRLQQTLTGDGSIPAILQLPRGGDTDQKQDGQGAQGQSASNDSSGESSQGTSGKSSNDTSDQESSQDNADNQPPRSPGSSSDLESINTTTDGHPVTITFIEQVNAGKVSLANNLLQVKHFTPRLVRNRGYEDDFQLPGIRIRALPGYGVLSVCSSEFLRMYPIAPEEVVIMVMSDEMYEMDVLKNLLAGGHPAERILLVRNEFDTVVDAMVKSLNIMTQEGRYEQEQHLREITLPQNLYNILKDLKSELISDGANDSLTEALQVLINRYEQEDEHRPFLIFTSASDISTFPPRQDDELMGAIHASLTEEEQQTLKKQFIDIRPGNVRQLANFIDGRFSVVFEAVQAKSIDPASAFSNLLDRLNQAFGFQPDRANSDWEEKFTGFFGFNFNEKLSNLSPSDYSELDILKSQFRSFYTGHILDFTWYQFISERMHEKDKNTLRRILLHRWALTLQADWEWPKLQVLQAVSNVNVCEALINILMHWSAAESPLTEELHEAIEQQLITMLEYSDNKFSQMHLYFELDQLQQTLNGGYPILERVLLPRRNNTNQKQDRRESQEQSASNKSTGENSQETPDANTTTAVTHPITITFIGQVNAGKSSLANCLLQINHFDSMEVQNKDYERDFKDLPGIIKIRSLPGYGNGKTVRSGKFLKKYPIAPEEIVIMVMASEMDDMDETVLKGLLENGHSPKRILLVRNKFDEELRARPERKNLIPGTRRAKDEKGALKKKLEERQQKVLKELQQESSAYLTAPLQTLIDRYNQNPPGHLLTFTSASDISTFKPDQDEALVTAIYEALNPQEEEKFKKQFIDIRPGNVRQLADFIGRRFSDVFQAVLTVSIASANAFTNLLDRLNQAFGLPPEHTNDYWQEKFKEVFGFNFHEKLSVLSPTDDSKLETLERQFRAFYTGHILGSVWYQFIDEMMQEEVEDKFGQTRLHRWARAGQAGKVWLGLQLQSEKTGELLAVRDNNGRTPLHLAVYSGSDEAVEYILEQGGDPDAKDNVDYTPLHWAAYFGQESIAEQLLQHDASLTGHHRLRITPLHVAAWRNQGAMVKKLLDWGADINSSAYGTLPLHYAAATGSLDSLESLLAHDRIRVNDQDNSGYSALHYAAWNGHKVTVTRLVDSGADQGQLTADDYSAGDLAWFRWHELYELTRVFPDQTNPQFLDPLDIPAPLLELQNQHVDYYGYTKLHRAAREGDEGSVRESIRDGAAVNAKTNVSGYTPLHVAALYGHTNIVVLLLGDRKANKEAEDVLGNTPLHLAALYNREETIEALLLLCANPDARNHLGNSVLHFTGAMGSVNIVKRLYAALEQLGSTRYPTIDESIMLHIATKYGNIQVMEFLYQEMGVSLEISSVDLELVSKKEHTPLHTAVESGQVETVKWLIKRGVALAPVDNNDVTPLFLAASGNCPEIIKLLGHKGNPEHLSTINTISIDLSRRSLNKITPLHYASGKGYLEAAKSLVKYCKAKLMTRSDCGWAALHFAANNGHLQIVQWLIDDQQVPPDITSTGNEVFTPFILSMQQGHTKIAAMLKKRDADKGMKFRFFGLNLVHSPSWLEVLNDKQISKIEQFIADGTIAVNQKEQRLQPLHRAASSGQYLCTELLIKNGADLFVRLGDQSNDPTALELAVRSEHPEIIKLLIESGCKPENVESSEFPLIVLAIGKKHERDVDMDDDVGMATTSQWFKPLAKVVVHISDSIGPREFRSSDSEDTRETIKALLAGGSSLEQKKDNKWTPLHLVTMREDTQFAEFLLDQGAKTETPDQQGRTALHWAAQLDNDSLMALLLEKGANKEATNKLGNTPLHRTADQGKTQTLQWLLEHGANPNAQNNNGETPLILAAKSKTNNQQNRQEKIEALLNFGAELGIKDTNGRNGLSYIFESLPAAEAESILHKYSDLITRELLNDHDKLGYYPKDWIRNRSFRMFVEGLTFRISHGAEVRDAEKKNNRQRLELLQQPRFE